MNEIEAISFIKFQKCCKAASSKRLRQQQTEEEGRKKALKSSLAVEERVGGVGELGRGEVGGCCLGSVGGK